VKYLRTLLRPLTRERFAATILPALNSGLNWYLGDLTSFGRIKVNRSPVSGPTLTFTNSPGAQLQIPIASLTSSATDPDGDAVAVSGINLTTTNGVTLVTNGTTIFYSNNANSDDAFDYTIDDGHGGSATGVVIIAASIVGQFISQPTVSGEFGDAAFRGWSGADLLSRTLDQLAARLADYFNQHRGRRTESSITSMISTI